jgi:hypothetical protein
VSLESSALLFTGCDVQQQPLQSGRCRGPPEPGHNNGVPVHQEGHGAAGGVLLGSSGTVASCCGWLLYRDIRCCRRRCDAPQPLSIHHSPWTGQQCAVRCCVGTSGSVVMQIGGAILGSLFPYLVSDPGMPCKTLRCPVAMPGLPCARHALGRMMPSRACPCLHSGCTSCASLPCSAHNTEMYTHPSAAGCLPCRSTARPGTRQRAAPTPPLRCRGCMTALCGPWRPC